MTTTAQPHTEVKVQLIGEDGNAFNILGKVSRALREAGYSDDFIREYQSQAMSGDYDNLLQVTMQYVDVE
jgi:uncharacterized protein YbgA (DUF1722 family)